MGKDGHSSRKSSRAVKRLEPYNKSPGSHSERRNSDHASRSKSRSHSRTSADPDSRGEGSDRSQQDRRIHTPKTSEEPPAWARELLSQQRRNAEDLKRLKSDLAAKPKASSTTTPVTKGAEHVFRFEGNKNQYRLNQSVVDHIDRALASDDGKEIRNELSEGKKLLTERNKHILIAEKYGWDTVHCYTAEPLASDSEDEKRIRKAIKESKALRSDKKAEASRSKAKDQQRTPRRPVSSWGRTPPGVDRAGKFVGNSPREAGVTCFRCWRPGHIARECRSANSRHVIAGSGPSTQSNTNQN